MSTVDHLFLVKDSSGTPLLQTVSGRQPGSPNADPSLTGELEQAVDRGLASVAGTRVVAGTPCQDFAFLEPVAGVIKPLTGSDRDLICLDPRGLVLREEWTLDGRVVQRKEAVEVDVRPTADELDRAFDTSGAIPPPGTAAPEAVPRSEVAGFFPDPPAPVGFQLAAVSGFRLPAPQQLGSGPVALLYASTVWAFSRGADAITVEAGSSTDDAVPWADQDRTRTVPLPAGKATSVLRSDGPELRIDLGARRWLRVRGTGSLDDLVSYARQLRRPSG
jgi:hypothetical protein